MRKKVIVVAVAIASAITLAYVGAVGALAASRTDTSEVLGATRSRDDAGEAAVLGTDRTQNSVKVSTADITDAKVLADIEDKTILADTINSSNKISGENDATLTAEDLEVLAAFEVSVPQGTIIDTENPIFITFTVPGLTEDAKVHVMHYKDGIEWEEIESEEGNGYVVGEFTSLSPVAIVAEKSSLSASANTSKKGTGSATSPRTGDDQTIFVIIFALIAIFCVSATFISLKKEKH